MNGGRHVRKSPAFDWTVCDLTYTYNHNLINALWLDDVIAQFRAMGWSVTTPAAAFADPVYQLMPDRPAAGQSLLLSMARTLGLGKFDGWERLVDDGDYEMRLLKRL